MELQLGNNRFVDLGENYLCLFAADSQSGTTNNLGLGTPFTGNVTVYPIYYVLSSTEIQRVSSITTVEPACRFKNGILTYSLNRQCPVAIRIFDMLGKKAYEFNRLQPPGSYTLSLKRLDLPSGRFIAYFKAGTMEEKISIMGR